MTNDAPINCIGTAVACSLLVLLLVTNVPLFLCMPLTDDAAMYDLQALNWLHGGMLYRDILEPNLPGVIWLHAAVRWTLGTSSMALRSVDLLLFTTFVALSRNWLASSGATRAIQAWSVLVLFVCYFSFSEWCHCQRDIWLLVPGLAGLTLRRRQIERLRFGAAQSTQGRITCSGVALLEGTNSSRPEVSSPKGPVDISQGHRPGLGEEQPFIALKGRNKITTLGRLCRPFRAWATFCLSLPGRCPGLVCGCPFEARTECATSETASEGAASWAFLEGLCWGAGVWLKPMIILPAACCWILSVLYVHNWRRSLVDLLGLMSGGLLIGGLGVAELVWSGAWPYFVTTLVDWNPRYVAAACEQWTFARFATMQVRFFPWQLLHLAAIPIALVTVGRQAQGKSKSQKVEKSKSRTDQTPDALSPGLSGSSTLRLFDSSTFALFSLFYLAWLIQSYWLQHLFDYVHAPAVLLAIVMVAASFARRAAEPSRANVGASLHDASSSRHEATGAPCSPVRPRIGRFSRRCAVAAFAVLVSLTTPVVRPHRLACWGTCVTVGSTAQVRDRLKAFSVPNWQDFDRVAAFLREHRIRDGELTCYNSTAVHLYGILGLGPSTRYVYLEQIMIYFPDRHATFLQALSDSRQRYVVTDLIASGLSPSGIARLCAEGPLADPPRFPSRLRDVYPWSQPAVFRAGPYLVHRAETPLGLLEPPRKPP
jgi:hypothetical protein